MHIIQRLVEQGRGCEFHTCTYNPVNVSYPFRDPSTHGDACFAVQLSPNQTIGQLVSYILDELRSERLDYWQEHIPLLVASFATMKCDKYSMDRTIVYFPGIKYEKV